LVSKSKFFWLAAPFLWALIVLGLCTIPGKDLPAYNWFDIVSLDKWVHAFMFAVQYLLLIRAFSEQYIFNLFRSSTNWVSVFIAIFYGGLTEIYQHLFLVDRVADIYDFIANVIGVLIGIWIYKRYGSRLLRVHTEQKTF
jgi:hypothetical protein